MYKLPLDIDIYSNGKKERTRITLDSVKQTFSFASNTKPDLINVDAEKMIVGTKKDNHSKEEWIYMLNNAALYLDRYESIVALDKYKTDSVVQMQYIKALNDSIYSIRISALNKIKDFNDSNKKLAYAKVKELALNDEKSSVRARAAKVLADNYKSENNQAIFEKLANEQSFSVLASMIKIYADIDSTKAYAIAKKEENADNFTILGAIAELYSKNNNKAYNQFYLNTLNKSSGFDAVFILPYYKNYIKKMDDETIKSSLPTIKELALSANNGFIKSSVKMVLKEAQSATKDEVLKKEIEDIVNSFEKK